MGRELSPSIPQNLRHPRFLKFNPALSLKLKIESSKLLNCPVSIPPRRVDQARPFSASARPSFDVAGQEIPLGPNKTNQLHSSKSAANSGSDAIGGGLPRRFGDVVF